VCADVEVFRRSQSALKSPVNPAASKQDRASAEDQVFRIGGEEFAILSSRPHSLARLFGESISHAVKTSPVASRFELTVSAGVSTVSETTRCLAYPFALADQSLYKAKSTGRDRVVGEPGGHESDAVIAWTKSAQF
jgi:diguanylate cyclase (GGDEF)-like protein